MTGTLTRRWVAGLASLALACGGAAGQSLARKGWAGNGITVAPWWRGAVFYAVRAEDLPAVEEHEGGAQALEERLDALRAMGVDALIVADLDEGAGQQFDQVVGAATQRRLRVIVDLPVSGAGNAALVEKARFWLSRGAAGLRIVSRAGNTENSVGRRGTPGLEDLERLTASFSGQRVLIHDVPRTGAAEAAPTRTHHQARRRVSTTREAGGVEVDHWMQGWPLLDAGGLRRVLTVEAESVKRAEGDAVAARLIDGEDVRGALAGYAGEREGAARRVAAALMLGSEAPLLGEGMAGEGELRTWYQALSAVRHGDPAARTELLQSGDADVVAWVRVSRASGGVAPPAVLVIENFSDRPVVLRLGAELRRAGVTVGSGTLRLSAQAGGGDAAGTARVDELPVAAGGVLVGTLPGAPGLEASPEPVRRRRR